MDPKSKVWDKNTEVNPFIPQIFIDYIRLDVGNTMMNNKKIPSPQHVCIIITETEKIGF